MILLPPHETNFPILLLFCMKAHITSCTISFIEYIRFDIPKNGNLQIYELCPPNFSCCYQYRDTTLYHQLHCLIKSTSKICSILRFHKEVHTYIWCIQVTKVAVPILIYSCTKSTNLKSMSSVGIFIFMSSFAFI